MKNNGFFSIYALLWLYIVSAGAILIIVTTAAVHTADQEMKLYDAQLVSIYRVKKRLREMNRCTAEIKEADTDSKESNQDDDIKNHIEKDDDIYESDETACMIEPETFTYHDIIIHIIYEKDSCEIHINTHRLNMYYDIPTMTIIDLV